MEILAVVTCLFLGYWIVSAILDRKIGRPEPEETRKPPPGDESSGRQATEGNPPQPWHMVLGVAESATIDEIRRAYQLKMSQYHPDKVAALGEELRELADRKSKEINAAYEYAARLRG